MVLELLGVFLNDPTTPGFFLLQVRFIFSRPGIARLNIFYELLNVVGRDGTRIAHELLGVFGTSDDYTQLYSSTASTLIRLHKFGYCWVSSTNQSWMEVSGPGRSSDDPWIAWRFCDSRSPLLLCVLRAFRFCLISLQVMRHKLNSVCSRKRDLGPVNKPK